MVEWTEDEREFFCKKAHCSRHFVGGLFYTDHSEPCNLFFREIRALVELKLLEVRDG